MTYADHAILNVEHPEQLRQTRLLVHQQPQHPLSLEEFLTDNMAVPSHKRTLAQLKELVARLQWREGFWKQFVLFKPDRYYWKHILRNDDIEIVLICWCPGQQSFIHPHKGTALNVTKVLQGSITQQYYAADEQRQLVLRHEETVTAGSLTWVERYDYHQLVNHTSENCITLHFYSPARD